MAEKRATKSVTFRLEPTMHAQLPELSRLHGGKTLSQILRRLLLQELQRLGLAKPTTKLRVRPRLRHAV